MPQVSIIVPVYNVERYLGACLDSLRAQTMSDIEIICIDDASTDKSLELLAVASRDDARIKVIRHSINQGLSVARNTGIAAATAPWILFIDSDDLVSTRICEDTLAAAESVAADVVFFSYIAFNDGALPPPEPVKAFAVPANRLDLLRLPAFAWTKLVSTNLLRSKKIEFPVGLCFEDVPVHWQIVLESSRPIFLDEALVWYRQRASSITYRKDWSRGDSLKIYDLVRRRLEHTAHWIEWRAVFLSAEMVNFACTHAYYALANPELIVCVRGEARRRMTFEHWNLALHGGQLNTWQRDYILARCRPEGVSFAPSLIIPVIRQAIRDPLRRLRRLFYR